MISRHDRLTCDKVLEKLAKKLQRNWPKSAKFYDILTVSFKKLLLIKLKYEFSWTIRQFFTLPGTELDARYIFLNDQFSGRIRKGAISYRKVLIKWKFDFFGKNPAPSLFSFHRPLTTCQVSEKNNEQILRKLCCKRTDGRTNRTSK